MPSLLFRLWTNGYRALPLVLPIVACWLPGPIQILGTAAWAQSIIPATDGTGTVVTPAGNRYDIGGGQRSRDGINLFHSFDRLGLNQGEIANFQSTPAIQNILGRVIGGNPSYINGLLQVSGGGANLYLMNPAGIVFGPNASLNVPGSFLATTANSIGFGQSAWGTDAWFNAIGTNDYAALVGVPNAFAFTTIVPGAIANFGHLTVPFGQSLTLFGGTILNTGTLAAPGGQITIAAVPGENLVRLSQPGQLLSLEISALPAPSTPTFLPALSLPQLLTGGTIDNATGTITQPDGTIQLIGSQTRIPITPGTAIATGTITVAAPTLHTPHPIPQIAIVGDRVALLAATLDASNPAGGGTIRIGGDYQGQGTIPNASRTVVDAATTLRADGISVSTPAHGGRVIIWSDEATQFAGTISARGGTSSGDGGFAEVSGKNSLAFTGQVDLTAFQGQTGTLLLDPTNITVIEGAFNPTDLPSGDGSQLLFADNPGGNSLVNNGTINAATANVVLQATNDITFDAPVNIFTVGVGLTAQANNNITATAEITTNGGAINLISGGSITAGTLISSGSESGSGGAIALAAVNDINVGFIDTRAFTVGDTGGTINLSSTAGRITIADTIITGDEFSAGSAGDVVIAAQGDVTLTAGVESTAAIAAFSASPDAAGAISITSRAGSIDVRGGYIGTVSGFGSAVPVTLSAAGNIFTDDINTNGGAINLSSNGTITTTTLDSRSSTGVGGSISLTAGEIDITNDLLSGGGNINLTSGTVQLPATINTEGGNFRLSSSERLSLSNSISTDGGTIDLSGAEVDVTGATLTPNGGSITLAATTGAIRAGTLNTSSTLGNSGAITLTAAGDVTTGTLTTEATSGDAGNITVQSGGAINTSAGFLSTSSANGNGGDIALVAAGNITTGGDVNRCPSNTCYGAGSIVNNPIATGGTITIRSTAGSINTAQGWIASGGPAGNAGTITLEAAGDITTAAVAATAGANNSGNNITLTSTTGSINTSASPGFISSFGGVNGGAIALNAAGNITIGDGLEFRPFGPSSLVPVFAIDARSVVFNSDGTQQQNGLGGSVTLTSRNGAIRSQGTDGSNFGTAISSSGAIAGTITLQAFTEIAIDTGGIDASGTINGGNVVLDPIGDIAVPFINAQGGRNGQGGSIDITAGQFFRANSSFIDQNGVNASLSTAAARGGAITIRHAGGFNQTPFIVGDATLNGTAGAITTGSANTIQPFRSFAGSYTQGSAPSQIRILTFDQSFDFLTQRVVTDPGLPQTSQAIAELDLFLAPIEAAITNEFVAYLNLPETPTPKTIAEARDALQKIEQATGIRPALIYISFVAEGISAPGSEAKELDDDTHKQDDPKYFSNPSQTPHSTATSEWHFTSQGFAIGPHLAQSPSAIPKQDSDVLELILVTAEGAPVRKRVTADRATVLKTAQRFRNEVSDRAKIRTQSYLPHAQQLYRWLIAPLEPDLHARKIQNLVFILDAGLRSMPLAAMHDGKGFLMETYSMGLMPSLSLTDTRFVDIKQAQVLAAGASQFTDQNPLPAVTVEIAAITKDLWKGNSLLNENFTLNGLKSQRQRFPFGIIHLATHGEFLPGEISNSYIQLWDTKLRLDQIRQLGWSNPPVELVVLSACRMAVGDVNAELGFAGFAVQAGAKTALASLWNVSDEGTSGLMSEFYTQLQTAPIKAEALRRSQLAMLNGQVMLQNGQLQWSAGNIPLPPELALSGTRQLSHPYYWSAFTLIGSPW